MIALRFADPEPLPTFRNAFFDLAQGLLPPGTGEPPAPVAIVDIDDASLARLGQWPGPRDLLAEPVSEIARQGPRAPGKIGRASCRERVDADVHVSVVAGCIKQPQRQYTEMKK